MRYIRRAAAEEFAKHYGIILYQTASLGIEKDCPMVAYAIEER